MTAGERFKTWLVELFTAKPPPPPSEPTKPTLSLGDRLAFWAGGLIANGFVGFMDILGQKFAPALKPLLDRLNATDAVPVELKVLIDEMLNPTGEIAALLGSKGAEAAVGGALNRVMAPFLEDISRGINIAFPRTFVGPDLLLRWYLRHPEEAPSVRLRLAGFGFDLPEQDKLIEMMEARFPSEIVGPAWLRDKAKYGKFWDDVYEVMGIKEPLKGDDPRVELLKEMAYRIPGVQDIIRYVVKEAYDPDVYREFGQDQEYPTIAEADAEKAGVRPDMLLKEWIAHWDLPSVGNGFEMLHRGEIDPLQLANLLKAKDIMPFWRKKLTAISWSLPTRIEVRMMAQLGLVDKQFIMTLLERDGLAEEYRSVVADMNIVRGIRSDLQTRYSKKWLDSAGVKDEIEKSGLSPEIGERLFQWIVTNAKPERTATERDLTAAEIIKGVKKGIIDWSDGIQRLIVFGYDEEEAAFKMATDVEVIEEAPTTELNVRVDTLRRLRRQRIITREGEISELLNLGLDTGLATAYADNDDLRLVKETSGGT